MVKEKGLEAIWNEGICYVKHEDYLEVVEENENLQKSFDMMRNLKDEKFRDVLKLEKELKEKDGEIEKIIHECERKRKVIIVKDNVNKELRGNIEKLEKENEHLKEIYKTDVTYQKEEIKSLYKQLVDEKELLKTLEKENENLRKISNDLFKLTKFISEERACYGRAGEHSVDIVIDTIKTLEMKLKEKDLKIEELHYLYLSTFKGYNNQKQMIKELKEHNEVLTAMLESLQPCMNCCEEEKEETYTLLYGYESNGVIKEYKQSGLLKEEYEEMYGMDSDNWEYHTLVKD